MTQSAPARTLPPFVTEDWLALLRGAVLLAWGYAGAMALARAWALLADRPWPTLGDFHLLYGALLGELVLVAATLSVLALRRDWCERIPRAALSRVRTLVTAVLVWLGLHHLAAFHVVGGMAGPLLPALPLLVVAAFLALPRRGAWTAAIALVFGHALVAWLERAHLLQYPAPLAEMFAGRTGPGHLLAYAVLAAAFAAGAYARRRLDAAGATLHRGSRLDPLTGLYEPGFLVQRLGHELRRQRRLGGTLTLALIEVDGFASHAVRLGYSGSRELLRGAGEVLIASTRTGMDTPARHSPTAFAVLLPDATPAGAREVLDRVDRGLAALQARLGGALHVRSGLATVEPGADATPESVIAAATAALGQAAPRGQLDG